MIPVKRLVIVFIVSYFSIFYATDTSVSTKPALETTLTDTDTPKKKSRMRKQHNKGEKKPATYKSMNCEQLLAGKERLKEEKNYTSAIKYLTQLIKIADPQDTTAIGTYYLEIADLLFADKQYAQAFQHYTEFTLFYTGHEQIEYGLYKAIESHFNCILSFDRDQTKTEETLSLAQDFLKQDHFSAYKEKVETIAHECRQLLAQSDLNICSFYVKKGNLKVAEKQINSLKSQWLEKCPSLYDDIMALEADIKEEQNTLVALQEKDAQEKDTQSDKKKRMTERF